MGQEILYCQNCKLRITTAELQNGQAIRMEGQVWCQKCAKSLVKVLPREKLDALLQVAIQERQASQVSPPAPRPMTERRTAPAPSDSRRSPAVARNLPIM